MEIIAEKNTDRDLSSGKLADEVNTTENGGKKYKVVFPFVEAGLGHIMPMKAICDAFEKKYGDKAEVIRSYFFQDKNDPKMQYVEQAFVKEVKNHNKNKVRGLFVFFLLKLFGARFSMKFVMQCYYGKGYKNAMKYIEELNPDMFVNTHFSTIYYADVARQQGKIKSKVIGYCPDPFIGAQWDDRLDVMGISCKPGLDAALKRYKAAQLALVPFMLRGEVKNYDKDKAYYRRELGLPQDNFTVLLTDGGYGAAKLKKTAYKLLKSNRKMTVIAVCGKNEKLYQEFLKVKAPENIHFAPYGFTDKTLALTAAADVFAGKAGASNMAEPAYFGVPAIVTYRATVLEKWTCQYYEEYVGSAVLQENVNKAAALIEKWCDEPALMDKYREAAKTEHRSDGPEIFADLIWQHLIKAD